MPLWASNAPVSANVNLVAQIVLAFGLLFGLWLARSKKFTAHRYNQSAIVALNIVLIATIMVPHFFQSVAPQLRTEANTQYVAVATAHAIVGLLAVLLSVYVVLVAATSIVPRGLRFTNYKRWMRATLAVWWLAFLFGLWTYNVWYNSASAKPSHPSASEVIVSNYRYSPKVETISPGTRVTWFVSQGPHTVDFPGRFKSGVLQTGAKYSHTFTLPGTFHYHCDIHGLAMSGIVRVR